MKHAIKVAKRLIVDKKSTNPKIVGFSLAATAPDAFDAPSRITEIALSETGKVPEKPRRKDPPKPLPSAGSPLALREDHRLIRSRPMYSTLRPRSPGKDDNNDGFDSYGGTGGFGMDGYKNFDLWNPESMNEEKDGKNDSKKSLSSGARLDRKARAAQAFFSCVDRIVQDGIPTSSGSGHTLPVMDITATRIENIVQRVPSKVGFLDNDALAEVLGKELAEVQLAYSDLNKTRTFCHSKFL